MKGYIKATIDGREIASFPLIKDCITVGRAEECDIKLPSGSVSRKHLRIFRKEGRWYVEDMGSSGGTFLNGRKIQQGQPFLLTHGDRLTIPGGTLTFLEEVTEARYEKTVLLPASWEEEVLVIDGKERKTLPLPAEIGGFSIEREGNSLFISQRVRKGVKKRKEFKKAVRIRANGRRLLLLPPGVFYIPGKMEPLKAILFIIFLIAGFFISFPEKEIPMATVPEVSKVEDSPEKRVLKLMEERDWEGARAEMFLLLSSGKSLPSLNEYMRKTYEEEKNMELFERGKNLFKNGMLEESIKVFSEISTGSVYFPEAMEFMKMAEEGRKKETPENKGRGIPPYLSYYLKGDLESASREGRDVKIQVMISQMKGILEELRLKNITPEALDRAERIDRKIDPGRKGKIATFLKEARGKLYLQKAKESLQNGRFEEAFLALENAKLLLGDSEEVKKVYLEMRDTGLSFYQRAYSIMEVNPGKAGELFKKSLPLLKGTEYEGKIKKILNQLEKEK